MLLLLLLSLSAARSASILRHLQPHNNQHSQLLKVVLMNVQQGEPESSVPSPPPLFSSFLPASCLTHFLPFLTSIVPLQWLLVRYSFFSPFPHSRCLAGLNTWWGGTAEMDSVDVLLIFLRPTELAAILLLQTRRVLVGEQVRRCLLLLYRLLLPLPMDSEPIIVCCAWVDNMVLRPLALFCSCFLERHMLRKYNIFRIKL